MEIKKQSKIFSLKIGKFPKNSPKNSKWNFKWKIKNKALKFPSKFPQNQSKIALIPSKRDKG